MFTRVEGLKRVLDLFEGVPVMVTVGACWVEWDALRPSDGNFALKTLGSGSSVGLGVAMALPKRKVAVLDGDGAVLMNMNGVATVGQMQPKNLIHVVFDNESLLSVGGFPTATSTGSDIAAMAAAAGVPRTMTVTTVDEFKREFAEALAAHDLTTLVAKVEAVGPSGYVTDLALLENRYQFQRHLRSLQTSQRSN
jgi:sulfopyruvate decarboxylase subunit beta